VGAGSCRDAPGRSPRPTVGSRRSPCRWGLLSPISFPSSGALALRGGLLGAELLDLLGRGRLDLHLDLPAQDTLHLAEIDPIGNCRWDCTSAARILPKSPRMPGVRLSRANCWEAWFAADMSRSFTNRLKAACSAASSRGRAAPRPAASSSRREARELVLSRRERPRIPHPGGRHGHIQVGFCHLLEDLPVLADELDAIGCDVRDLQVGILARYVGRRLVRVRPGLAEQLPGGIPGAGSEAPARPAQRHQHPDENGQPDAGRRPSSGRVKPRTPRAGRLRARDRCLREIRGLPPRTGRSAPPGSGTGRAGCRRTATPSPAGPVGSASSYAAPGSPVDPTASAGSGAISGASVGIRQIAPPALQRARLPATCSSTL
jgi:hypothetical protein